MKRCLIYALGGGLGHAVRGASLARALTDLGVAARVLCSDRAERAARSLFDDVKGLSRASHPTRAALWRRVERELDGCDCMLVDTFPRGILGEFEERAGVPRVLLTRLMRDPPSSLKSKAGWAELGLAAVVDIEPNLEWLPGPALRCGPIARWLAPASGTPTLSPGSGPREVAVALTDTRARNRVVKLLEREDIPFDLVDPERLMAGCTARIVIGRCGYNLSYELASGRVWHVGLPAERPLDDQAKRAAHLGVAVQSPQALQRRIRSLLQAKARPAVDVYEHRVLAERVLDYALGC